MQLHHRIFHLNLNRILYFVKIRSEPIDETFSKTYFEVPVILFMDHQKQWYKTAVKWKQSVINRSVIRFWDNFCPDFVL